jgi:hypothetical protein
MYGTTLAEMIKSVALGELVHLAVAPSGVLDCVSMDEYRYFIASSNVYIDEDERGFGVMDTGQSFTLTSEDALALANFVWGKQFTFYFQDNCLVVLQGSEELWLNLADLPQGYDYGAMYLPNAEGNYARFRTHAWTDALMHIDAASGGTVKVEQNRSEVGISKSGKSALYRITKSGYTTHVDGKCLTDALQKISNLRVLDLDVCVDPYGKLVQFKARCEGLGIWYKSAVFTG